jgi:diaminopimelate decarboxylase/aspartate kinase
MMECLHDWWRYRKEELLALAENECPLYVYNEESINDTLFDLLAVDAIDDLFYPVHENPHPQILRKVFELGADFKCISSVELDHLLTLFPELTPKRILFVPDDAHGGAFERVVRYGVHVAVKDPSALRMLSPILKHRKIFISMDMDVDQADKEVFVAGFYFHPKTRFPPLTDTNKTISFLAEVSRKHPDFSTLILGSGMHVRVNREQDVMDIPGTGEFLEALNDACPQWALWLEPGRHMVSHAGVLLARVTETGEGAEETDFVRIYTDTEILLPGGLPGTRHEVVNLSKSNEEAAVIVPFTAKEGSPGKPAGYLQGPACTEKGDILLITNTGAYGPGRDFIGKQRNSVSEYYLAARRMCPVKI